jgi:hypothetical protein
MPPPPPGKGPGGMPGPPPAPGTTPIDKNELMLRTEKKRFLEKFVKQNDCMPMKLSESFKRYQQVIIFIGLMNYILKCWSSCILTVQRQHWNGYF